jgi:TetR/AcrR family transcriptional regulator, transcriptional repressor of bet genes
VSSRKKKLETPVRAPRARTAHSRQRQRLIDACISALHIYGPSRTTVEKVVAIAKMSPGIVRFYFDSKAAMLVASLQFLSAEFEEQLLVPVSRLKSNPVAALELLVDLYLDPEIASPRKVSVWYAFWGEASSRQEYYDICGQKDENFAALVRELIGRLIDETSRPELDPDGVALGLIGVLEMLWQDFAFRSEGDIDRPAAKRRCMAYLKSIFPGRFSPASSRVGVEAGAAASAATVRRFAGWVYGKERAYELERAALFQGAWQVAAHESQIAHAGEFLTVDVGVERVLLVRDAYGDVHALRNSCPEVPHALVSERCGRFEGTIDCRIHALKFEWDGRRAGGSPRTHLTALDTQLVGGLLMVRSSPSAPVAPTNIDAWLDAKPGPSWTVLAPSRDIDVAANWKVLVEQWLESATPAVAPSAAADSVRWVTSPVDGLASWSAERYRRLAGTAAVDAWQHHFVAPNQLLQSRPDGLSIHQVIPTAAGRSRLRRLHLTRGAAQGGSSAAQYLAARLSSVERPSLLHVAESAQRGVSDFGYRAFAQGPVPTAVAWFRQYLAARVPALALERPPTDS